MTNRFADLIPEQPFGLSATEGYSILRGNAKTAAIEAAYDAGFTGCFLPSHGGDLGRAAMWFEDEFRDTAGRSNYRFDMRPLSNSLSAETEFGHVASKPAFETFERDRLMDTVDWLFGVQQNWGDCVDSSKVELEHGILGIRAADPSIGEVFQRLMGFYAYAFRGSCGHGWYMGAAASVALQHGYCLAEPTVAGFKYLAEQDSETLVAQTWCRNGPPQAVRDHVAAKGWQYEPGAITQFSGGIDAMKQVFRSRGQFHHGSNTTSGSSIPARLKGIGGHAQTAFGGDWSEPTLRFFRDAGLTIFTEANFPVAHHQTWGGNWSGAVDAKYWPPWWGARPQGAWITTAQQCLDRLFKPAYVYLPLLKGIPGTTPTPPPPTAGTSLSGSLRCDNASPIRGQLTAGDGDAATRYIIVPSGDGTYKPARMGI